MSKRYPGGILRKTPQNPTQTSAQGIWDMASVTQAVKENNWPIAGVPDPISKSLRFRSSASAYLNRTATSTVTDNKKLTVSYWVKRGRLSTYTTSQIIMYSSGGDRIWFDVQAADTLSYYTPANYANVTGLFRDPSAWYHIVMAIDTTQATAANRVKVYVNGSERTVTGAYPTLNQAIPLNTASQSLFIGSDGSGSYFDGYLAKFNFIDGQALTPSSFGGTNDQTGVWQPIAYTGTYGTNGFYLPFSDTTSTSTLGTDFSGNNNNWTTNNISLTSGATYDSMVDVPTQWIPYNTAGDTGALYRGNYCVMNPLMKFGSNLTWTNGNLQVNKTSSSTTDHTYGTTGVSSGKWYWEMTVTALAGPGNDFIYFGVARGLNLTTAYDETGIWYSTDGTKENRASGNSGAYGATWLAGDTVSAALDLDAGTITFYKNGVSQGVAYSNLGSYPGLYMPYVGFDGTSVTATTDWNFGQRPFSYTPPAGFNTLCTTNLSTPTIGATSSSLANKYFDATTYTGNGSTQSITNSGSFQPDLVWIKGRSSSSQDHTLVDFVRGISKTLRSNSTTAELNQTGFNVTAFNSNGFSVTDDTNGSYNVNGSVGGTFSGNAAYVGWQWRASNASGVTNTAGSITSTVSANTTAGFSIVTYTGNGIDGSTVGHGLGVAPKMVIVKSRSNAESWRVFHSSLSASNNIYLNATNAQDNITATAGGGVGTSPSSTTFTLVSGASSNANNVNTSTWTYVAYCFAEVAGYSAFGSYTGNGSSDGPFVFTGFQPRYVLWKRSDSTGDWIIFDSARDTYNYADKQLVPNTAGAEQVTGGGFVRMDFLSNGFKVRSTDSYINANGGTYIYMAFAESPFKYALAR